MSPGLDKIPSIPANWFSAAASAVFLLLALSGLRTLLAETPQDVSRKTTVSADEQAALMGPSHVIGWADLDDLLAKRGNAIYSLALFIFGATLSLLYLVFPADANGSDRASQLAAFAVALAVAAVAWSVATLSRGWWHKRHRPRWFAHVWLAWLESEVPSPLADWGNIADDPIAVVLACPHPELKSFLNDRHATWTPTIEQTRRDIEAWLRAFVARWRYRFVEPEWERWRTDSTQSFTPQ